MSQRNHLIGVVFLGLSLGVVAAALRVWAPPGWTVAGLVAMFLPVFVVSHGAAERLGSVWDRWRGRADAESGAVQDSDRF